MRFSTLVACASAALVAAPLTAFAQDLGTTCGKNTCQVAEQCCTDTNICIQPADFCCATVAKGFCAASETCCGTNCCAAGAPCCGSVCCASGQICGAKTTCEAPTCSNTLAQSCGVDESTITCKKGSFPTPSGLTVSGVTSLNEQCTSGDNVNTCNTAGSNFVNFNNCAKSSSSSSSADPASTTSNASDAPSPTAASTKTDSPFGSDFPFQSSATPGASDASTSAAAPTESPTGSQAQTPSSTTSDASSSSAAAAGTSAAPTSSGANTAAPFIGTVVAGAIIILASVC